MKKFLALVISMMICVSLVACGGDNSTGTVSGPAQPPDLTGEWQQTNSTSEDSYQAATISDDTIEIYWVSNGGDTKSLYWAGTYVAPTAADSPYTWISENDHSKTDTSLLASGDDTKTMTYQNGILSYEASALGTTTTVKLEKQVEQDQPPATSQGKVPDASSSEPPFGEPSPSSKTTPDVSKSDVSTTVSTPSSVDSNVTTGQKNALKAAKNYLSLMPFSHDGLISQLEFEQYSSEDATYAADNCGSDWNEQALKSAKNYLSTTAFSYKGLISQLEFEKYTTDQATYGADNCGADWTEQAVRAAKNYLDIMSFSRDGLIDQLEFEGYTHEQAVSGAEANGY